MAGPSRSRSLKRGSSGSGGSARGSSGRGGRLRSPRAWCFIGAAAIFGGSTWLAFSQAPRPHALLEPAVFSSDWWRYPVERNAFLRLPIVTADLNDVFALPDSKHVWAVGDGGLIMRSEDGGATWSSRTMHVSLPAMPPRPDDQDTRHVAHCITRLPFCELWG